MAIPKFEDFLYPFMSFLMKGISNKADMRIALRNHFNLSEEDLKATTRGGSTYQFNDRIGWSLQWLRRALFVEIPSRGIWQITDRGREYMNSHTDLLESDLLKYPEFASYSGRNSSKGTKLINHEHYDNWLEFVSVIKSTNAISYETISYIFRILGWRESKGTLLTDPNSRILQIKSQNSSNIIPIIIEGKEYTLSNLNQTLKRLRSSVGLIISDKIELYYKQNQDDSLPIKTLTVSIKESDNYGPLLCELLSYNEFSHKRLIEICNAEYVNSINSSIKSLCSNSATIIELISNHLIKLGYEPNLIERELSKYDFSLQLHTKQESTKKAVLQKEKANKSPKTKIQFSLDGGETFHSMRSFVHRVIKTYVKDHPKTTYEDLEHLFPSRIISELRGIIRPYPVVVEWSQTQPDILNRYFIQKDQIISLTNNEQIVVNNQWTDVKFDEFLKIAQKFYEIISDKPYAGCKLYNKGQEIAKGFNKVVIRANSLKEFKNKK